VDPIESDSTYSNPVSIAGTATLKARAYKIGWNPSDVDSGTYTVAGTVATPTFSPPSGTYPTAQKITISCSTYGATIYYTTNGMDPKETNTTYSSPIFISHTTTLKARAYKSGMIPSGVAGGKYTMNTSTIYCMGNSITAAGRYENILNDLLGVSWGVVNLGITGQTTAQMLARFTQDVIMPGDAKYVIVLGGVNDVRVGRTASQIEPNLQSMYTAAHNAGIKVVAVSILPFKNFKGDRPWAPEKQAVLDDVNAWILTTAGNADYKVNAYTALEDPVNPDCLLPAYDSGDGLHPNWAGHIVLANAIYHAVSWTH
jgi:lysophospholipase L1-like esterase